jgi:hypothetical protein
MSDSSLGDTETHQAETHQDVKAFLRQLQGHQEQAAHPSSSRPDEKFCELLDEYLGEDGANWAGPDVIELTQLLVGAMKDKALTKRLQAHFISTLLKLGHANTANCDAIKSEGMIEAMTLAIRSYQDDPDILIPAFLLLGLFDEASVLQCPPAPPEKLQAVSEVTLTAIQTHMKNHIRVVQAGLRVLWLFQTRVETATFEGYLNGTLECMRTHAEDLSTQALGCAVLDKLAFADNANREVLWDSGAVGVLTDGVKVILGADGHYSHQDFDLPDEERLVMCCLETISKMHLDAGSANARAEPGLIVVPRIIIKYVQSIEMLKQAYFAIFTAAARCPGNREILGRQAIRAVLLGMRTHKQHSDMHMTGLNALIACTRESPANAAHIAEPDVLRILLRHAEAFMECGDLRIVFCMLLKDLSRAGGIPVSRATVRAGCVKFVVQSMSRQPAPEMKEAILRSGFAYIEELARWNAVGHVEHMYEAQNIPSFAAQMVADGAPGALLLAASLLKDDFSIHGPTGAAMANTLFGETELARQFAVGIMRPIADMMVYVFGAYTQEPSLFYRVKPYIHMLCYIMPPMRSSSDFRRLQDEFTKHRGLDMVVQVLRDIDDKFDPETQTFDARIKTDPAAPLGDVDYLDGVLLVIKHSVYGHRSNQDACCDSALGVISTVLSLMRKYDFDPRIQTQACGVLHAAAFEHVRNIRKILTSGGLELVSDVYHNSDKSLVTSIITELYMNLKMFNGGRLVEETMPDGSVRYQLSNQPARAARTARRSRARVVRTTVGTLPSPRLEIPSTALVCVPQRPLVTEASPKGDEAGGEGNDSGQIQELESECASMTSAKHKSPKVCSACGKSSDEMGKRKMLRCSVCSVAPVYCSTECQHAAWPGHKAECKANRLT